jgi:hypothetical protein
LSGKDEIQKLIETLRAQNIDLGSIRKQRESSKKNSKPRFRKDLEHSPNPDAILAKVLQIRKISKTLYQSLAATAGCHCHRVNLELQGFLEQINSPAGSLQASKATKFRLVVSNDSDSNGSGSTTECHCTSIIINSEFDPVAEATPPKRLGSMDSLCNPSKRVRFASPGDDDEDNEPLIETTSAKAVITISDDSNTNGKRTVSVDIGPGRKKVRLSFDAPDPGGIPTAKIASSAPLSIAEVDNLCTLMRNLQHGKPVNECLGRISTKGCKTSYRHLIYRGGPSPFQTSRTSLESILCRDDKQVLIPRVERLRIAVTLAASILHSGSYTASWFQERWRSRDIFFFLPQQRSLAAGRSALQPHVVPEFPRAIEDAQDPDVIPPISLVPSVARNEQLFSLALVLIEIAFGDKLFNIYEPARIAEKEGDPFAEYMKAKMILDSGQLEREMGVTYAQVISGPDSDCIGISLNHS